VVDVLDCLIACLLACLLDCLAVFAAARIVQVVPSLCGIGAGTPER
jgi:hypothetical protein